MITEKILNQLVGKDVGNLIMEMAFGKNYTNNDYYLSFLYGHYEKCQNFKFIELNEDILIVICEYNYVDIIKHVVKTNKVTALKWGGGMAEVLLNHITIYGNLDTIKLLIDIVQGSFTTRAWNQGLYNACVYNHIEIVKLMIEKGADDFNWGLYGACEGGRMDIVEIMIENGANDWNSGLSSACYGGHMNIVKLMIKNGATHNNIDAVSGYYLSLSSERERIDSGRITSRFVY